jgi:hypothetical protein
LSVSSQTINLNGSGKASVTFSLTTSTALNLDVIGLDQFSVLASPNFANSSTSGVLTISGPISTSQTPYGTYPFSFEAVAAGSEILSVVSMNLVYSATPSSANSNVTTSSSTSSSNNSSFYFGLFSSYTVRLTRYLVGPGGTVVSSTPLYSVFSAPPSTSIGFVNYTLNIETTLGHGISSSGYYFVADFQTFGSQGISPDATPITLASGNGWSAYDFRFTVPATGGSLSFLINATSLIDGTYAAAGANVLSPTVNSKLANGLATVEGLALSKVFVSTMLNVTKSDFTLATISKTSLVDYFSLPATPSQVTTTTSTATTSSTPPGPPSIAPGCSVNGSTTVCVTQEGPGGQIVCVTSPTSHYCYQVQNCLRLIVPGSCEALVPTALNIQPGQPVRQLSVFGFLALPGTPLWAVESSDVLFILAAIVLVMGVVVFKDY